MRYLKTNTATIVTVGPFYDKTDGVTIETGLTITNERITFVVDNNDGSAPTLVLDNVTGATSGTSNDLNYIANCDAGLMQLELAAANVNYLGRAFLTVTDAANHVPVFHEFMILPAMVFDSLIAGTDVMDASMTQILGTAVSTPATAGILDVNLKNIANATVSTSTAQLGVNTVQAGATAWGSGAITEASIASGAIANAKFAADVGSTALATNMIAKAAEKAIGVAGLSLTAIPWNAAWDAEVQSEVNDEIVLQNLDHLLKTATAGVDMTTEVVDGSIISRIISNSDTSLFVPATTNFTTLGANVTAVDDYVDTEVGALTTELAKVPKSDGTASWNATALAAINAQVVDTLTVDVIADSVAAHEARPTIAQALLMITRLLMEKSVSTTTVTVKKEDGSTSAMTFTLDDATNPTSITRTT